MQALSQCPVCFGEYSGHLYPCSRCGRLFHDKSCGHVPLRTDYQALDADDVLRGQTAGSKREYLDLGDAHCAICLGRLPADENLRKARLNELAEKKRLRVEKQIEKESLWNAINHLEEHIQETQKRVGTYDEQQKSLFRKIADLEGELILARHYWKECSLTRSNVDDASHLTDEMERVQEYGCSLHYQVHQSAAELSNCQQAIRELQREIGDDRKTIQSLREQIETLESLK